MISKDRKQQLIEAAIKLEPRKHVTFIGRTQPPHAGHVQAVQGTINHAEKNGASHTILLTHTHDKNNPLTPEQKLHYAQKSFPGANIQMTSSEHPSLLHHAANLYNQGIRDFTVVAGPERLNSYTKLLNDYNGKKGPHGFFNFPKIQGVSSGERDPDAEGVQGASGTAMKKAAASNDFESFANMASPHLSEKDKRGMFNAVKAGLTKFQKQKKLKEELTTGDVRGLGYVSGNSLVSDNFQNTWTALNKSGADTRDQILNSSKKHLHDELHANLQQKLADKKAKIADMFYQAAKGKK